MAKYNIIPSSRTIAQSPISIGHKAEKGVEAIEFDLTAWVETYGSGTLTVVMQRWGDAIPYPIALEIDENNKATWTLSDTDTAKAGMAYAQLNYIVGDEVVKKSDIYTFRVMDSLTGEGEPPEAYESWLEHLTHLAAEAMAEVLDIEGIVTDKTLAVDGGIADAKATGDALALKADKSTTYTKAQVDQMIEDVEIETDTTLSVSGAPADAKATGDALSALEDQFTEETDKLKADLDSVGDLISDFYDTVETPIGNPYVPLELGNIGFNGTRPIYAASTTRVRTVEGRTLKLKAGDTIGLSDYSNAKFWASWLPDGESTWAYNSGWQVADYTATVDGEYILIITNRTEVAQESAEALGSLLVVRKNNSYHTDIIHELSVSPITHYEMPFIGYIASDGVTIMPMNAVRKEKYTDYIPVQYGKKYVIDYRVKVNTTTYIAYCTYDSEKAPVLARKGYDRGFVLGDDGYYRFTFVPTIADNVAYIRVSGHTYGDSFLTICEDNSYICTTIQPVLQKFRKERDEAINAIYQPDICRPVYSPVMYDAVCKGINHRGAYRCPENTMIAYETSKADGFYFVETDVRVTSDDEFVLLHNESINSVARNADGTTISETVNIADITLAEALTYDFGIARGQDFAGTKIATLAEFLTYCKRALLHPYIEIKFTDLSYIDALVDMVDSHGLRERSTYITGNVDALKAVVAKDKMARVGYVASNPAITIVDTVATLKTGYNDVFISVETIQDGLIDACIAHKIPLELWPYSSSDEAILAKPDYVTGFTHNTKHAGKVIYDSVVTE